MPVEDPEIDWQGDTPRSTQFNDIYYSPENGLQESQYVFLKGNKLGERWQTLESGQTFIIAETGFGTGLNFLASCLLWSTMANKGATLHFISFEKYPLPKEEIKKAISAFPELADLSTILHENYPKRITGLHHIQFNKNIKLSLYFGDALEGIRSLDANSLKVDAWFFDGFSPKENISLWSEELFQATENFNDPGTTCSTFTAAGHVKRKLEAIGFDCQKTKGFGNKREMLTGACSKKRTDIENTFAYGEKPWLIKEGTENRKVEKVAVIGAGLAGSWTAFKLSQRNIEVDMFDKHTAIATEASGNSRGATYFRLEANQDKLSIVHKFYLAAYQYAIRDFAQLFSDKPDIWQQSGLLQLAINEKQTKSLQQLSKNNPYKELAYPVTEDEGFALSGIRLDHPALFFPEAGHAAPGLICEYLCENRNIHFFNETEITGLDYSENDSKWNLISSEQETMKAYDAVVIANSHAANSFQQSQLLALNKVRGQSTQISSSTECQKLSTVICTEGYLTPAIDGIHTIGSTFDPKNKSTELLDEDNQTNLDYLEKHSPHFYQSLGKVNIVGAKAALRSQTPDTLPVLGQLCDHEDFIERYKDIAKGQLKKRYPPAKYLPGLYINSGHASRGLISSPYCAEILAAEICNEVSVCEKPIKDALSPTRFYIRELKRS